MKKDDLTKIPNTYVLANFGYEPNTDGSLCSIISAVRIKTIVIAQNAAQKMNQEYEMLTLKQQEEIETLKQRKREERDKEKQSGDQRVNEIQVQLDKMNEEKRTLSGQLIA